MRRTQWHGAGEQPHHVPHTYSRYNRTLHRPPSRYVAPRRPRGVGSGPRPSKISLPASSVLRHPPLATRCSYSSCTRGVRLTLRYGSSVHAARLHNPLALENTPALLRCSFLHPHPKHGPAQLARARTAGSRQAPGGSAAGAAERPPPWEDAQEATPHAPPRAPRASAANP